MPGPGTPLGVETWTGTTGAAWPGQWTIQHASTTSIQANAGRITVPSTTTFDYGRADLSGMGAAGSFDLTYTMVGTAAGVNQFCSVSLAGSGDVVPGDASTGWYPHTGYALEFQYATTAAASTASLYSLDAGPQTALGSAVTVTLTGTTRYSVRVQKLGAVLQGKVWTAGTAEPSAWTISQPVTNTYSGTMGFTVGNGAVAAARSFDFDDLLVCNGIDVVPPVPRAQIIRSNYF